MVYIIRRLRIGRENGVLLEMQWAFGVRQASCRTVWDDAFQSGAVTFGGRQTSDVSALLRSPSVSAF